MRWKDLELGDVVIWDVDRWSPDLVLGKSITSRNIDVRFYDLAEGNIWVERRALETEILDKVTVVKA